MPAETPGSPAAPTVFVRHGGTTTSAQDKADAKFRADTARRRAVDQQRRNLESASARGDASAGIAKSFSHKMTSHQDNLVVVLNLVNRAGTVIDWSVCELSIVEHSDPPELMLIMVCPRCVMTLGRPQGESQLRIRQSNRMFSLDTKKKDEIWVNPSDPSEVYTLAGTITSHGRIRCPAQGCGFTFEVEDSNVREI